MIRISALDDHPIILEGYRAIYNNQEGMTFVAGFTQGDQLLDFLKKKECDILILDMHLAFGQCGLEWAKTVRKNYPGIKLLGTSTYDQFGVIKIFMQHGGYGFILKSAEPEIYIEAIQTISQGEEYFHKELKDNLFQQTFRNKSSYEYIPSLTKREKEVLQLIVDGQTTQEIADILCLSTHTIESHRNNLMAKLNVNNVALLVRDTLQKGLLDSL